MTALWPHRILIRHIRIHIYWLYRICDNYKAIPVLARVFHYNFNVKVYTDLIQKLNQLFQIQSSAKKIDIRNSASAFSGRSRCLSIANWYKQKYPLSVRKRVSNLRWATQISTKNQIKAERNVNNSGGPVVTCELRPRKCWFYRTAHTGGPRSFCHTKIHRLTSWVCWVTSIY